MVRSEKVMHKENNKGVVKSYEMNADNQLIDVTISGYRILHKKILKENDIIPFTKDVDIEYTNYDWTLYLDNFIEL